MKIKSPSVEEANNYLKKFKGKDDYPHYAHVLETAFTITYPKNERVEDILPKVALLDELYSTNVKKCHRLIVMANHIKKLKIDKRLKKSGEFSPDYRLVHDIARLGKELSDGRKGDYSFASKYCSFHKPNIYPIYDSYISVTLKYFRKTRKIDRFSEQ